MNKTLAEAILAEGSCQEVAEAAQIDRHRLDLIVQDVQNPTWWERRRLAVVTGKEVTELFADAERIDVWH